VCAPTSEAVPHARPACSVRRRVSVEMVMCSPFRSDGHQSADGSLA
jgi:hypothetical protein